MVDAAGENLGVLSLEEGLRLAREKEVDLIEVVPAAKPPVCRLMSFDNFRYQKEKEEKKREKAERAKEMKQIRITPRAARNDLEIKLRRLEKFLEEGHKVEINLLARGREKGNREWNLGKINEFLKLIKIPHQVTMPPRPGGRGLVAQVAKK